MTTIASRVRRAGSAMFTAGTLLVVLSMFAPSAGASPGEHGRGRHHHDSDSVTTAALSAATDGGVEGAAVSDGGANATGPYNGDPDGSPSGNGNGDGNATGQPCAGCVGNADDKNPPGQLPGPQDDNNGYECDGNNGIAKTNPAHTGCTTTTTAAPTTTVPPTTATTAATTTATVAPTTVTAAPTTTATVLGVTVTRPATKVLGSTLARTGTDLRSPLLLAGFVLLLGGLCLLVGRREEVRELTR